METNKRQSLWQKWYNHHRIERIKYCRNWHKKNKQRDKEYYKNYYLNNIEKIREKSKKYYHQNKEERLQYRYRNKNKLKKYKEKYDQLNKKKHQEYRQNRKLIRNKKMKEYMKIPKNRILRSLRIRLYDTLKRNSKSMKTIELLGCSIIFFQQYIEKQFEIGMNWGNYGRNGWHIDHIIPCCKFNLSKQEEQRKCFHYTNLRPLWATENLKRPKHKE